AQESLNQGAPLRLERLRHLYGLDSWDIGVIILCLAPELDLKYVSARMTKLPSEGAGGNIGKTVTRYFLCCRTCSSRIN
ncbi:MAG TPA: hypothetical protein VFA32_06420, partial [Dehalococcoidia bacterium]|nr:hypothetical protein [Dehalococcoidia bacterium]